MSKPISTLSKVSGFMRLFNNDWAFDKQHPITLDGISVSLSWSTTTACIARPEALILPNLIVRCLVTAVLFSKDG